MASAQRGNGYDPKLTKIFVDDIEKHHQELKTIAAERMAESKGVRETIAEIYDRAKDAGIPKRELKAVISARDLERRAKEARQKLDEDQAETFDQIRLALGDLADTPLGKAATGTKKPSAVDSLAGDDDEQDLRPRHLRNKDVGTENAAKVAEGIKPLN